MKNKDTFKRWRETLKDMDVRIKIPAKPLRIGHRDMKGDRKRWRDFKEQQTEMERELESGGRVKSVVPTKTLCLQCAGSVMSPLIRVPSQTKSRSKWESEKRMSRELLCVSLSLCLMWGLKDSGIRIGGLQGQGWKSPPPQPPDSLWN